jgi:hypothetical protein
MLVFYSILIWMTLQTLPLFTLVTSRLGDVVVTLLATGPKGCGSEPNQGDGFLKGDKNLQHTFLWMGSKARGPMS